ncbi:Hypothetical protein, predicted transmembrane protein [Metamycoplasma auris 15026]|uniref:Uncharacterized protein n=1 Tax=Metamycoplasma auris 15026 TaxID=1188233 RepID=N9V062_9BACT|nr:Hypothetical protein, predicted transmembrane protein [Metamycoplasma auris 15026]
MGAFGLCLSLFLIEYRSVFIRDKKSRKNNKAFYGKRWKISLASVILSGMLAAISVVLVIVLIQNN